MMKNRGTECGERERTGGSQSPNLRRALRRKHKFAAIVAGLAVACLLISGCTSLDQALLPSPQTTQEPYVPTSFTTSPTAMTTLPPSGEAFVTPVAPQVTPLQGKAYIQRPYGYTEFVSVPSDVAIAETHIVQDSSGNRFVAGTLRNKATTRADFVQITFNLFNSNGAQVGNAIASVYYLRGGSDWKFQAEPAVPADYQYHETAAIFVG